MTVRARVAVVAAGAAALGGCGSAQPPAAVDRSEPSPQASAIVVQTPAYQAQSMVLERARGVLVRRCMAARGFRYDPPPLLTPPVPALPSAGRGYGIYEQMRDVPAAALAAAGRARRVPRGYRRALDGTTVQRATVHPPDGIAMSYATHGCDARATAALHGSVTAYFTAIARQNGVITRTAARLPDDAGERRATARWSTCMRRHGRRFQSPVQAREAVLARATRIARPGRIRALELRVAGADRACAQASAVYREQRALDRGIVAAIEPDDVTVLEQLARSRRAAVERARAILVEAR